MLRGDYYKIFVPDAGAVISNPGCTSPLTPGMNTTYAMTSYQFAAGTRDTDGDVQGFDATRNATEMLVSYPSVAEARAAVDAARPLWQGCESVAMIQTTASAVPGTPTSVATSAPTASYPTTVPYHRGEPLRNLLLRLDEMHRFLGGQLAYSKDSNQPLGATTDRPTAAGCSMFPPIMYFPTPDIRRCKPGGAEFFAGTVTELDGVVLAGSPPSPGMYGWDCQRALTAADDGVADVKVCTFGGSDKAGALATHITNRVRPR